MKTKRKNRIKKAVTKRPEQIGVCRFIDFKDVIHLKANGRYVSQVLFVNRQGLQIEHIFYYVEAGEVKRALINKRNAKIIKIYDTAPEWAPFVLIEKQLKYNSQIIKPV